MRAAWLIGVNFVREQRIVLMVFVAWLFGFVILFSFFAGPTGIHEYEALFQQQALYGVVYGLLVALSTIHGERKSRRILAVLSKGIYRGEYIAGLMLGNAMLSSIYMGCLGIVHSVVAWRLGFHASLWPTIGAAWLASILAGSIALFFGSFLHPSLAAVGSSLVVGLPKILEAKLGAVSSQIIPVDYVVRQLLAYSYEKGWSGSWHFLWMATIEIVVLWALAAMIFARRDVTVAIE
jgi:ABC-type transport system involved in multi-copper enzyme maturation permease subunit